MVKCRAQDPLNLNRLSLKSAAIWRRMSDMDIRPLESFKQIISNIFKEGAR